MPVTIRIGHVEVGEFVSIPSVGARGQVTAITCDWPHWDRRLQRYAVSVQSEPEGEPVVWTLSGDRIAVVEA